MQDRMNKRILKTNRLYSFSLFSVICLFCTGMLTETPATDRSVRKKYFDDLEATLRADYRLCTGDSSDLSLDDLMAWRRTIDSILTDSAYPTIITKFTRETGIRPSDARPCEVVNWMKREEEQIEASSRLLSDERTVLIKLHEDSLYLAHELEEIGKAVYDFLGVPFGLSKRGFLIRSRQQDFPKLLDNGRVLVCDSIRVGNMSFKAAFHFTGDNKYWCYEFESESCSIDSLDIRARALADYLGAYLETVSSHPPDHIYRIGMLDIIPGRLSICRFWNFPGATAYAGLARSGNRFYAKLIVRSRTVR